MTKEESYLIIAEQNKSTEEILKAVAKVKSDYHELCKLKDMRIAELEAQIEKMKCCGNCKYSAQETVYSIVCEVGGVNKGEIENVEDCLVCDEWEIKEND